MFVRRLLALLVAVGLVLAAVVVRSRLFSADQDPTIADSDVQITCARELAAVCDALAPATRPVTEDATTTVERFAGRQVGVDVWLTMAPWPQLAAATRARAGLQELSAATSPVVARSPVVVAGRRDRLEVLEPTCDGGRLGWRCIGDRAGRPWSDLDGDPSWGRVKVGLAAPATSAEGLLALSQATSEFFDGQAWTSRSLASTDYFSWLSGLGGTVEQPTGQTPLERMLLTGGADFELTGGVEATMAALLRDAPQRADQIAMRALDPVVTADVVVVGYGDAGTSAVDAIAEQLAAPLADAGWRVEDGTVPSESTVPGLPQNNGLPSAAALEALRQMWIEVSRG